MTSESRLHAWRIEPREYARQEARRGRRHAYERLVPAATALVVVDMVPFFVAQNPYCRGVVPQIERLAAALRQGGGTVAWMLPAGGQPPTPASVAFYGAEVAAAFAASGGQGPLRQRLWQGLNVQDGDLLLEKKHASAFFPGSSGLLAALQARRIDTVLVAGTVSNVCCESTARDASTLGLRVVFVADANAARRDQDHNSTLHTVYRSFGDVRPTAEVVALLDEARLADGSTAGR